jgi:hypothetical protein
VDAVPLKQSTGAKNGLCHSDIARLKHLVRNVSSGSIPAVSNASMERIGSLVHALERCNDCISRCPGISACMSALANTDEGWAKHQIASFAWRRETEE